MSLTYNNSYNIAYQIDVWGYYIKIILTSFFLILSGYAVIKISFNVVEYFNFSQTLEEESVTNKDLAYQDLFISLEDTIDKDSSHNIKNEAYGYEITDESNFANAHNHEHDHGYDSEADHVEIDTNIHILSIADARIIDWSSDAHTTHDIHVLKHHSKAPKSIRNLAHLDHNQYVLPISDALEINTKDALEVRERFKKEISSLHKKRKLLATTAKKLTKESARDIKKLTKILKSLGVAIPKNVLATSGDTKGSKLLQQLNMTPSELAWRYPSLKNNITILNKLRVFVSFLPIHLPVLKARRSSKFGYRRDPFNKRTRKHSGIDFAARSGTALIASGVGVVKYAGRRGGYGNVVEIYHNKNMFTRYAHMSRITVKKGQRIAKGQKIGAVGSTGRSTGPHLHYEIRIKNKAVNPANFLNKRNNIYSIINKY